MQASKERNQPLYITIGPPCAGKTTLLERLEQRIKTPIHDVALDNQRDVYVQVPTDYFLVNEPVNKTDRFLNKRIQYKSLERRIYDNATNGELRAILQFVDGRLSFSDFEACIRDLYLQHANETSTDRKNTTESYQEMATIVTETVQDVCKATLNVSFPQHVQLFCVESLFRPHPATNLTGIDAAHIDLQSFASVNTTTVGVAWGNTNTRPREFRQALEVAADSQRPVYFIVYATSDDTASENGTSSTTVTSSGVHLPHVGLKELYRRNMLRMLSTGKFIPGRSIMESSARIEQFMELAVNNLQRRYSTTTDFTKLQLDQELARMVNFEMNSNRTVQRMDQDWSARRRSRRPQQRRRRQRPQPTASSPNSKNDKNISKG